MQCPLVFFDLETTGLDIANDRIVEISVLKLMPDGTTDVKSRRINPEMHISEEATAVHHITDEDVKDAPTFRQVAKSLAKIFEGCNIAGFNTTHFDIPMLAAEFRRAGVDIDLYSVRFVDVQTIYHKKEPRNLSAAYRYYCGKDLEDAHSAQADIQATYEVLMAQLDKYDDLPTEIDQLSEYASYPTSRMRPVDAAGKMVYDDKNQELINFGKYKGENAEKVLRENPGYYDWIMKSDFATDTKDAFTRVFNRTKSRK